MRVQLYAAEPNYILSRLDRIENASEEQSKLAASMFDPEDDEDKDPVDDIYEEDGDEACITIEGMLTLAGPAPIDRFFGESGTSYRAIQSACQRASASPCKSVTFAINSPGGEVAGVDQTWQAMRALAQAKPCRAINTGIMASAAYWLGSAVGRGNLFADSPACEQGSIGVKQVLIDDSGLRDAIGVKKITIVSKNAPRKGDDGAKKADRDSMQERCDAMESVFIARVAEGRGCTTEKVIADFGQGGVLISAEAKAAGMIDDIITPQAVLAMTPSAPDNFSRRPAGMQMKSGALAAQHTPPKEKPMTLKELLASDVSAKAEFDAAMATATKAGADAVTARITAAQPFLALAVTKDGYTEAEVKQIQKCAVDVIAGTEDTGALRGFVRMVDMAKEQRALSSAQAETTAHGETPGQVTPAGEAALLAKAAELKIDVAAVKSYATASGIDLNECMKAAIETEERERKIKGYSGPVSDGR